jgi:cytidylate kinase
MAVITISRELGSGGEEIARLVCDTLKYRYFDKQVLVGAAADVGLSRDLVVDYSEDRYEVRNLLSRLLRSGPRTVKSDEVAAAEGMLSVETVNEAQYVALIETAVRAACTAGDYVILGRGGQSILQDQPNVLHVRVVAPTGARIARLQQVAGVSVVEAEQRIARQDRATSEYLGRFFGIRWNDPTLYHLTLNTGKLNFKAAANLIVDAVVGLRAAAP